MTTTLSADSNALTGAYKPRDTATGTAITRPIAESDQPYGWNLLDKIGSQDATRVVTGAAATVVANIQSPIRAITMPIPLPNSADDVSSRELDSIMRRAKTKANSTPSHHWVSTAAGFAGVEVSPWVNAGKPSIAGTRIPVSVVIGYLTLGPGIEALRNDYPALDDSSIQAAVDFALDLLGG